MKDLHSLLFLLGRLLAWIPVASSERCQQRRAFTRPLLSHRIWMLSIGGVLAGYEGEA